MKPFIVFTYLFVLVKCGFCSDGPPNKDFVLINEQVWVLQDTALKVFDLSTGEHLFEKLKTETAISSIAKDLNNNIVVDQGHEIKRLDVKTLQWHTIGSFNKDLTLFKIFFNKQNHCFLLTDIGVVDLKTGEGWFPGPEVSLNLRSGNNKRWDPAQIKPDAWIDNFDNIWIYYFLGEWGGDMFIFNTHLKQFIKPDGDFSPGYVFAGDQHVYCSSWGSFFGFDIAPGASCCYKITGHQIYSVSDNEVDAESEKRYGSYNTQYHIGMAAVNPSDGKIYFLCDFGLYNGDPDLSLKTIDLWTKVKEFHLQPQNIKSAKHEERVYYSSDYTQKFTSEKEYDPTIPHDMWKMAFTDNGKLVFISYHDGLGVFDGKKITILDSSSSF
jgi:hypothetical protein